MRLRLLIPAALAAVATYTALVRDEQSAPRWTPEPAAPPAPAGPLPVTSAPIAAEAPAAAAHTPPGPATADSIFEDLAPSTLPPGTPTILDMLAGDPSFATPSTAKIVVEETARTQSRVIEDDVAPTTDATTSPGPTADTADDIIWDIAVTQDAPGAAHDDASLSTEAFTPEPAADFEAPLEEGRFALGGWAASAGHSVVSAVTFRKRLPTPAAADRIVLDIDAADNVPEGGLVVLSDPGFAPDRDGFTILLAAADPGPFSAAGSYRVFPSK